MATKIREPQDNAADINEWKLFLQKVTKQGRGYICLELTNSNSGAKPEIAKASRVEIGGAFYDAAPNSNEAVTGTPSDNRNNYIYARPNGETASFLFSNTAPAWNAEKGGWYRASSQDRAIAKFFYLDDQYYNKVILDGYNAMFDVNAMQTDIMTAAGAPVTIPDYEEGEPYSGEFDLAPGIYRYSVRGGDSGAGGAGGTGGTGSTGGSGGSQGATGPTGAAGGAKNNSVAVTGVFVWHGGKIKVVVGANGGNGGTGGKGGNGKQLDPAPYGATGNQGAKGGPGGGGGSGIDSFIGGIIGQGGKPTMGGNNNSGTTSCGNLQIAAPGTIGIGAPGLAGEGANTNYSNAVIGSPGSQGGGISTTTSGHARLWRV
jgi:hypothetical protein